MKVNLKLTFKEPLNFSNEGSVPEVRRPSISNKGLLTVKFDQNMQFDIVKLNEDLDKYGEDYFQITYVNGFQGSRETLKNKLE